MQDYCAISVCENPAEYNTSLCGFHAAILEEVSANRPCPNITQMGHVFSTIGYWYTALSKSLCDGSSFLSDAYWTVACWECDRKAGLTLNFAPYRRLLEQISVRPMMVHDAGDDRELRIATGEEVVASGIAWTEGRYGLFLDTATGVGDEWAYVLPEGWNLPSTIGDNSYPILPAAETEVAPRPLCKMCFCNHAGEEGLPWDECSCHLPSKPFLQPMPHDYDPDPNAVQIVPSKGPPRSLDSYYTGKSSSPYTYQHWQRKVEYRNPVVTPELDAVIDTLLAEPGRGPHGWAKQRRPLLLKKRIALLERAKMPPIELRSTPEPTHGGLTPVGRALLALPGPTEDPRCVRASVTNSGLCYCKRTPCWLYDSSLPATTLEEISLPKNHPGAAAWKQDLSRWRDKHMPERKAAGLTDKFVGDDHVTWASRANLI